MTDTNNWHNDLTRLESVEDFLDYFQIPYQIAVIQVFRLHILQRYHHLLAEEKAIRHDLDYDQYHDLLQRAYLEFTRDQHVTREELFSGLRKSQSPVSPRLVTIENLGGD